MCLALALFCVESKAIKIGKDFAGRTAADTHVYSRRASGGRPPRRAGRLENSHNGPSRNNRLSTARARTPRAGAATYQESTPRRHRFFALLRLLIDSPRVLETRSAVDVETTPSVRERAALRARATPTGRRHAAGGRHAAGVAHNTTRTRRNTKSIARPQETRRAGTRNDHKCATMATDENNHKNEARDDWTGCTFRVERGPSSEGRAWGMADILTDARIAACSKAHAAAILPRAELSRHRLMFIA